ncbi:unnamed protein product, partial [Discosporangium mesarthrocarpum]
DLTIDGLVDDATSEYRNKLLYVEGNNQKPDYITVTAQEGEFLSSIAGLGITRYTFKHASGECVPLRYFVTNTQFSHNVDADCGALNYTNGEGLC